MKAPINPGKPFTTPRIRSHKPVKLLKATWSELWIYKSPMKILATRQEPNPLTASDALISNSASWKRFTWSLTLRTDLCLPVGGTTATTHMYFAFFASSPYKYLQHNQWLRLWMRMAMYWRHMWKQKRKLWAANHTMCPCPPLWEWLFLRRLAKAGKTMTVLWWQTHKSQQSGLLSCSRTQSIAQQKIETHWNSTCNGSHHMDYRHKFWMKQHVTVANTHIIDWDNTAPMTLARIVNCIMCSAALALKLGIT